MSLDPTMGQSLKPLVSRLDASAANYITTTTSEGFLAHYYDHDEKPEPASACPSHPAPPDSRDSRDPHRETPGTPRPPSRASALAARRLD